MKEYKCPNCGAPLKPTGCGDGYHPGTRGNSIYSREFIAEVIRLTDQGKQVRL